jgi:hypothetical protein
MQEGALYVPSCIYASKEIHLDMAKKRTFYFHIYNHIYGFLEIAHSDFGALALLQTHVTCGSIL